MLFRGGAQPGGTARVSPADLAMTVMGEDVYQGGTNMDGNGQYWPGQPGEVPPAFYGMPADPLVSPNYEGWWQRSIALMGRVWKPALILHAILVVPAAALAIPTGANLDEQSLRTDSLGTPPPLDELLPAFSLLLAALLLTGLASSIATAITVRLVVRAATGQAVSLRDATPEGLRRLPALIGWGLLAGLLTFGSILLCILPVFYVAAVLMVLPVVVTLERGSGLGRCFALFHASLGTSVARAATLLVLGIVTTVVAAAIGLALESAVGGTAGTWVSGVGDLLRTLGVGLVLPPLLVTAYADMRSRLEPFSTAHLAPQPA
jgi:hypothetical protein